MKPSLRNRLVVVTGASSGIGAAVAEALGREGARVALWARRGDQLDAVAARVRRVGGVAYPQSVDLADADAVAAAAAELMATAGVPDIVINNAGAGRFLAIDETLPDEAHAQMDLPYFAAFHTTRAFVDAMLARGSGCFLMINSPVALVPWPGAVGYAASRWALRGFTEALRADLAGTGVAVGSFMPTRVSSDYFANNPGARERIPAVERLVGSMTPPQVADGVLRALRTRPNQNTYAPWRWALLAPLAAACPAPVAALYRATGWRRPTREIG